MRLLLKGAFDGQRSASERIGLPMRSDELQRRRQSAGRLAARQREGRMAGEVEELRELQHERPDRYSLPPMATVDAPISGGGIGSVGSASAS